MQPVEPVDMCVFPEEKTETMRCAFVPHVGQSIVSMVELQIFSVTLLQPVQRYS